DSWWVYCTWQGNKRVQVKLAKGSPPDGADTRVRAQTLFSEALRQLEAQAWEYRPSPNLTLSQVIDLFHKDNVRNQLAPNSLLFYHHFLDPLSQGLGCQPISKVCKENILEFLTSHPGWKSSRASAIKALKRLFNWAVEQQILPKSPMKLI